MIETNGEKEKENQRDPCCRHALKMMMIMMKNVLFKNYLFFIDWFPYLRTRFEKNISIFEVIL